MTELQVDRFTIHHHSWCGKHDSKHRSQVVLIFRRKLCCGSKKWRWLILWMRYKILTIGIRERFFRILRCWTEKVASALNKIIQNSQSKKKVRVEEQKAQKEDRFLRGTQIALMIYDYLRVTGAHDAVLDYADLFSVTLHDDNI